MERRTLAGGGVTRSGKWKEVGWGQGIALITYGRGRKKKRKKKKKERQPAAKKPKENERLFSES